MNITPLQPHEVCNKNVQSYIYLINCILNERFCGSVVEFSLEDIQDMAHKERYNRYYDNFKVSQGLVEQAGNHFDNYGWDFYMYGEDNDTKTYIYYLDKK